MAMQSRPSFIPFACLFVCAAALTGTMCSSSPSSPSTTDDTAGATGNVVATVRPNPVPFSGDPIRDAPACAGFENTWFYEQVLRNTGGVAVTFTNRIDSFDGRVVNNLTNVNIVVPANGEVVLRSRWCSGNPVSHTAQSSFRGRDASGNQVSTDAPVARLMSP
jgi:hypothetical protein